MLNNIKTWFLKFWRDPVWSKVIGTGIVFLLGIIWAQIQKSTHDIPFKESFNLLWDAKIRIVYVILILIGYSIIKLLFMKYSISSKQREFSEKNNKMIDSESKRMVKWKVYFRPDNTPFPDDIALYCTNHGEVPMKFLTRGCPMHDCINNAVYVNLQAIENGVIETLEIEWEKFNKIN